MALLPRASHRPKSALHPFHRSKLLSRLSRFAGAALAAVALGFAVLSLPAPAQAASLRGRHEVAYRLTTGQGEIQLKESFGHPDGNWRIELYWTVRGPGLSARQEAALGVWQRLGAVEFGVGGTWYARPSDPWDVWVTAAVPWERP